MPTGSWWPAPPGTVWTPDDPSEGPNPTSCLLKDSPPPPCLSFPDRRMEKTKVVACSSEGRYMYLLIWCFQTPHCP